MTDEIVRCTDLVKQFGFAALGFGHDVLLCR